MEQPAIGYASQIARFSVFPFAMALVPTPFQRTLFFVYLGVLLTIGGFLDQIRAVQLTESIQLSGFSRPPQSRWDITV